MKKRHLSESEIKLMAVVRDEWINAAVWDDEKHSDNCMITAACKLYGMCGLSEPKVVVADSLLSGFLISKIMLNASVRDSVRASVWDSVMASVEASVRDSVWDSVRASVWDSVMASVEASVMASVRDSVRASVWDSVGDSVMASVRASVGDSAEASVWDSVMASVRDSVRDSVEASVRDSVRDSVEASVRDSVWDSVMASARDSVRDSVRASVRASVWDSVRDSVEASVRDSVWDSVEASVWDSVEASVRDSVRASVRDSVRDSAEASVWDSVEASVGAYFNLSDYSWTAFYDCFSRIGILKHDNFNMWLKILRSGVSESLQYNGLCIVCRNPINIHRNTTGQVHCEGAPAILFKDGFAIWKLNNVVVPQWLAETPHKNISAAKIHEIKNAEARREFVRKVGIERICLELDAKVLDSREHYDLLLLDTGDNQKRPYLKMRNPSVNLWHIEGVHPDCTTVEQALIFRNGTKGSPKILT